MNLPKHIAIIMDGNGRWGIKKHNSRLIGHKHGIENLKSILKFCLNKKILNLTIYAFSKDNLKRSKKEVVNLFNLFEKYFLKNEKYFNDQKISIKIIGEKKNLPKNISYLIKRINFRKISKPLINLNVAFNYSSKLEIINTFKYLIRKKKMINMTNVKNNLYTKRSGYPDLIVRTGARNRLSDFLLWQISYSEIFFIKKMWPDFKPRDLNNIINKFLTIKRNFGS